MPGMNATRKLIASHRVDDGHRPPDAGEPVAIAIAQTLTQDATGTLVMLALESIGLDRVRTERSVQYVDHNLVQADHRNADDHLFLESACRRFGLWYSPPGNGVSHPVHMERFGVPGKTLLGSDSHTCAAGSLGMLAIGAGGLHVAMAMAGEPFALTMPEVLGVRLEGELPPFVSAKDVILEMLRRHGVDGGLGKIVEYHGPGLRSLTAMDRHVIANMGAELGATTTVFPADEAVRRFLRAQGREDDFVELTADSDAAFDHRDTIDLSRLVPLVACPSSPGNVVPVEDVAGRTIYQAMIGSSANPGFRDFAVPARIVARRRVHPRVSFDVNPTSRQIFRDLIESGDLERLTSAGARIHQAGCNGCIGMGQAPASGRISLRTVPRNFPGRSGTREDQVYLCSPETAAASALAGAIVDPRELDLDPPPTASEPDRRSADALLFVAPGDSADDVELRKGPNIESLPDFEAVPDGASWPVAIVVGGHVSTDEILPAGAEVLPYRSNVPAISRFVFRDVDAAFTDRAVSAREDEGGCVIVAGANYGQGSSREHAAVAPRFLGVRAVVAESFARIHRENLINFGVVPLVCPDDDARASIGAGGRLRFGDLRDRLASDASALGVEVESEDGNAESIQLELELTAEEREVLLAGGRIPWLRSRLEDSEDASAPDDDTR